MKWLERLLLVAVVGLAVACAVMGLDLWPRKAPEVIVLQPAASAAATLAPAAGALNVNTATLEELAALPGISRTVAQAILDARAISPFFYVEDLDVVPGIGEKRLEQIRPHIRVE